MTVISLPWHWSCWKSTMTLLLLLIFITCCSLSVILPVWVISIPSIFLLSPSTTVVLVVPLSSVTVILLISEPFSSSTLKLWFSKWSESLPFIIFWLLCFWLYSSIIFRSWLAVSISSLIFWMIFWTWSARSLAVFTVTGCLSLGRIITLLPASSCSFCFWLA